MRGDNFPAESGANVDLKVRECILTRQGLSGRLQFRQIDPPKSGLRQKFAEVGAPVHTGSRLNEKSILRRARSEFGTGKRDLYGPG